MRPRRGLATIVWKEIRALLPVWLGCVSVAALVWVLPDRQAAQAPSMFADAVSVLGPYVFLLTPIALGALSTGHEFSHGTWLLQLSQPIARTRLLAIRMGVLVAMTAAAGSLSIVALGRTNGRWWANLTSSPLAETALAPEFAIPLAGGLVVAPWFAVLTRTLFGGLVAAFAGPGLIFAGSLVAARLAFGPGPYASAEVVAASQEFIRSAWRWGMAALSLVAACGLVISMRRAEITHRNSTVINAWRFGSQARLSRTTRRRATAAGQLVAKELRLQIPTLAVAGLFGLLWGVTLMVPGRPVQLFWVYQTIFGLLLALLAGAVASAEERQFGTVDAQLLLPIAAWRQWALKVIVVTGSVAVLCVGLNVLLRLLSPADVQESLRTWQSGERGEMLAVIAGLTLVSLYVSSVTRSGLHALILGGAGALAMIGLVAWGFTTLLSFGESAGMLGGLLPRNARTLGVVAVAQLVVPAATALMAIRYAYLNHRFADVRPIRILRQISTMYVWLVGTMFLANVFVFRAWR